MGDNVSGAGGSKRLPGKDVDEDDRHEDNRQGDDEEIGALDEGALFASGRLLVLIRLDRGPGFDIVVLIGHGWFLSQRGPEPGSHLRDGHCQPVVIVLA